MNDETLLADFERELGVAAGGRYGVAVDGEVAGLRLALRAFGVLAGDEVVVPSYGPAGIANAVREAGGVPVFADIEPAGHGLDPGAVAAAVSPRTVAVVAAHTFGHPAAIRHLAAVAERYGLALLEYAGGAHGAALDGHPVGAFGVLAVFDTGVVTADEGLARTLRGARDAQAPPAPEFVTRAAGRLREAPDRVARRRAHARTLDAALTGVLTPYVAPGARHVYERYVVRVPGNGRPDRDAFARALAARGIRAEVPVPSPVHRRAPYRVAEDLPWSERAAAETLALPLSSGLSEREVARLVAACNRLGGLLADQSG